MAASPTNPGTVPNYYDTLRGLSGSQRIVSDLQARYGSMNPSNLQILRKQFYSFVPYGTTGNSIFQFFGNSFGNANQNRQLTNMPLAGTFGTNSFLLKKIACTYFVAGGYKIASWAGTDASAFSTEILNGLFQAGIFNLNINNKNYVETNKPFLYMPPGQGSIQFFTAGQLDANTNCAPFADLLRCEDSSYQVDPEIFIEAQQTFNATISYPSGAIASSISTLTDAGLVLYIGVLMDGVQFRPTT